MSFTGAWSIDFLLNVRSLRGKIQFEDLRNLQKLLPKKYEATSDRNEKIAFELEWDFAVYPEPKISTASPYIEWTDYWTLKAGSKLVILGESIPVKLAVLHGSTASLYLEAQKRNPTGDMTKIEALATDASLSKNEFFFGFSKRGPSTEDFDSLRHMGEQLRAIIQ